MLRRHMVLAAIFVALPFVGPAFTMYASSVEFRVDIVGRTESGVRVSVPTFSLVRAFPRSGQPLLMGTEAFRRTTDVSVLRGHLDDVAKLGCHEHRELVEVGVILTEHTREGTIETRGHATCAR